MEPSILSKQFIETYTELHSQIALLPDLTREEIQHKHANYLLNFWKMRADFNAIAEYYHRYKDEMEKFTIDNSKHLFGS